MNKNILFKSNITKKIFIYTCSLLVFNFLLISLIANFFLEKYTLDSKEKYMYDVYVDLISLNYESEEFLTTIDAIKYENIYVMCYDYEQNKIVYSNNGTKTEIPDIQDASLLIETIQSEDYMIIYPTSSFEQVIYNITGRQQQITIIGKYLSRNSNQYLILQMPYLPIIDITTTVSRFNIISSFIVLLISIVPTMAFTVLITKPIKEATIVAKSIKNKDFSQRCIIRTKDEISELEEAINIMADSIKVYTEELENANIILKDDLNNRKKIEQAQKEFISNVSHEIKTPISIISGYAEGIKQGIASTDEERDEYCDIIIDECKRMTEIVIELLNLSKLENGTIKLEYCDFNINELCEIIMHKFELKCKNAGIKLKLISDKEYFVRADYNEIEKVIINYMQNAYKHVSDEGTISIIIKEEGEYIYIGINNDGQEIPEAEQSNIWNKFYKIDKSHKREENSTGLGLSIVKATMDLHKMPYGVKNTKNGVEFYIKLQKKR